MKRSTILYAAAVSLLLLNIKTPTSANPGPTFRLIRCDIRDSKHRDEVWLLRSTTFPDGVVAFHSLSSSEVDNWLKQQGSTITVEYYRPSLPRMKGINHQQLELAKFAVLCQKDGVKFNDSFPIF